MPRAATEPNHDASVLLHRRDARGVHQLMLDTPDSFNMSVLVAIAQEGVQAFIEKRKPQWPA